MKNLSVLSFAFSLGLTAACLAQQPESIDPVSKEASQLEAELGKFGETTPEAADVMVQLVDLYHEDARVFGLVRVADRFTRSHGSDPRHGAVMLKLIDGLEAMSRTKDLVVACRQFLSRYPDEDACADVEQRLAQGLARGDDKKAAAAAYHAVYRRLGNSPEGRRAGVRAIERYTAGNDQILLGAQLGEEMLNASSGEFAQHVGIKTMESYAKIGRWLESNRTATGLLKKRVITDNELARRVHMQMAENYARMDQHTNSANSYQLAREVRDDQEAHYKLIEALNRGQAASREISPVVREYAKTYADRDDRFRGLSALAQAYIREDNPNAAIGLLGRVLSFDAITNDNGRVYVDKNGSEPEQLAETERTIIDAIKNNPKQAAYLRYVLAFSVYRDRMKDTAKMKKVLRDLIDLSPSDDGYSRTAIDVLLASADSDQEFQQDVKRIVASQRKHLELPTFGRFLSDWRQGARRDPKRKERVKFVEQQISDAKKDPLVAAAAKQSFRYSKQEYQARQTLLADNMVGKLSNDFVNRLLQTQGYYTRHYVGGNQRHQSADFYGRLAARDRQNFEWNRWWLESATDYAAPEVAKEAALAILQFPPQDCSHDVFRRLMLAADKNSDKQLAMRALEWILKCQSQFGKNPYYMAYVGDILHKLELKSEATKLWQVYVSHDRQHSDSRECASRLLRDMSDEEKIPFLKEMLSHRSPFQGRYASWLADEYLKAKDLDAFASTLVESRKIQDSRPFQAWDLEIYRVNDWVYRYRRDTEASEDDKRRVYEAVRGLRYGAPSAAAELALLELGKEYPTRIQRVLAHQRSTLLVDNDWNGWDTLFPYAQSAIGRSEYLEGATIAAGLLAHFRTDERREKNARDIVTQSYARMGSVGLTIDEDSPIAPLLQAALYLRLGDEKLAMETYDENQALFDEHRNNLPVDLISFVCRNRIAGGGDENHDYVEEVLRGWMVQHSESTQMGDDSKAEIQLLLARNYYKAQRFDVARSEFTTTMNRYPDSKQAIEAKFGIGESFMSQKVYDQAEIVFEELARSPDMDIVVRAEFLRGVLAFRRGDRDDAREIFRSVLERVPNVELANQALFNLSEVYGSEERYIDQLNLLRTVGRLGRRSKRLHAPGMPLSIVVHDSDLGISRGHNKIPVIVTTKPGGDREQIMLTSAGAGRGLFRADVTTRLGDAQPDDNVLQLVGGDTIECDYPDAFKAEFKRVPLSDVEITIAASAEFAAASSKIEDEEEETFSQRLEREAREEAEGDQRVSQIRPDNQIKPGNDIYMRVIDADRDVSNERDSVPVKLAADSGDHLQIMMVETGPHTGVFEASAPTSELPAGALASDTAIDHSPLMAIDLDEKSHWLSEPDGRTPKSLTVDMKDLHEVARLRMATPSAESGAPVKAQLQGSNDGEFWFPLASHPEQPEAADATDAFEQMTSRVYLGSYHGYTQWYQVVDLGKNREPLEQKPAKALYWSLPEDADTSDQAHGVIWSGKLIQERSGAVRISVTGYTTAMAVDGVLHLPVARGNQSTDLWLERGSHHLTIFAATPNATRAVEARIARADLSSERVEFSDFTARDFDLTLPAAEIDASKIPDSEVSPVELPLEKVELAKTSDEFGSRLGEQTPILSHWQSVDDTASWDVNIETPGAYTVWFNSAHPGEGSQLVIETDQQRVPVDVPDTRDWNRFQESPVATIVFDTAGMQTIRLVPKEITGDGLMDLKEISLRPISGAAVVAGETQWDFRFPPAQLRYARLVFNEYLGEAIAVSHLEIGGTDAEQTYIPTDRDVLALAGNDSLEIAAGDTVTTSYTDEFTQNANGTSQRLSAELTATYNNASITPITYDFTRGNNGQVQQQRLELKRVDPGQRVVVEIQDYDEDRSNQRDTIEFQVRVNEGEPVTLTATETEEYSGIFTKEVDTAASPEDGEKLVVKQGDRINVAYLDRQNTFPGHSVPREATVYVTEPTDAKIQIMQSRTVRRQGDELRAPQIVINRPPEDAEQSLVAIDAPLTVEVVDPDRAKNSGSVVKVALLSSDGAAVIVECRISSATQPQRGGTRTTVDQALEDGRFVGQVILQLGSKDSPQLVPKTAQMPRNLIGRVLPADKDEEDLTSELVARVLNVTGKDIITAAYNDKLRSESATEQLRSHARLVADGTLQITDREYKEPIQQLHVGEKIYFAISDPDQDVSGDRDVVTLQIATALGDQESVQLTETLAHSGYFTGSFLLKASSEPTPGNFDENSPSIECYFGDTVTATYVDAISASQEESLSVVQKVPVVVGTDGLLTAFSKTFNDEKLAVETKFRIAESYFELFKSHKELERSEEQESDLQAGRRVLREVMEDYPDPKYAPRVAYLLGQFAQELEQWNEAIRSYELIIRRYPDHTLAADARYKLAQSYEEAGDFDEALEAYVTLAATHPKSPLIASVMIRISDYFYKNEEFDVAAQVGIKFGERFDGHEHAAEMAFRVGQCYYKTEEYGKAGISFDDFAKNFPDDELGADSLFWSGEAYRLANNNREAFRRYNRCRWDYPESEAAKYARGRLALPEMLQQFEAEANSVDE